MLKSGFGFGFIVTIISDSFFSLKLGWGLIFGFIFLEGKDSNLSSSFNASSFSIFSICFKGISSSFFGKISTLFSIFSSTSIIFSFWGCIFIISDCSELENRSCFDVFFDSSNSFSILFSDGILVTSSTWRISIGIMFGTLIEVGWKQLGMPIAVIIMDKWNKDETKKPTLSESFSINGLNIGDKVFSFKISIFFL